MDRWYETKQTRPAGTVTNNSYFSGSTMVRKIVTMKENNVSRRKRREAKIHTNCADLKVKGTWKPNVPCLE